MTMKILLATSFTLCAIACAPREAGPLEGERGEIIFWRVTGPAELTFGDACTDAPALRDELQPPPFNENSYLTYRLSEDGAEAVAQDCTQTRAESCVTSETGVVFEVSGNELVFTSENETQPIDASGCELSQDQLWTAIDAGATMRLDVDFSFALVGDPADCAAAELSVAAQSDNGEGLDGCVISLGVDLEFFRTDS